MDEANLCPYNGDLPKQLRLDMSSQRSVPAVLHLVSDRMASQVDIALARIWLLAPGDIWDACRIRRDH